MQTARKSTRPERSIYDIARDPRRFETFSLGTLVLAHGARGTSRECPDPGIYGSVSERRGCPSDLFHHASGHAIIITTLTQREDDRLDTMACHSVFYIILRAASVIFLGVGP